MSQPPKHPASEGAAALFHLVTAGVSVLHLMIGVLGGWYHLTAAIRHYRDMKP